MVVPLRRADAAAHRDVIHRLQEKGLCRIKQLLSKNGVDFIEQFLLELLNATESCFVLTAGQRHDSKPVPELLGGLQAKALLADKAYDSDKLVQAAQSQCMEVIIACRVNRKKNPRVLDEHRYKARHLVENFFQRMKVFRRVATRYDKLDVTFLGFVHIAGTMKWLH